MLYEKPGNSQQCSRGSPDEAPNSLRATSQMYVKNKLVNPAMVRKNFVEPAIFIDYEIEGNGEVNSIESVQMNRITKTMII